MFALIVVVVLTPYLLLMGICFAGLGVSMVTAPECYDDVMRGGIILFLSIWCAIALLGLWSWAL
jgi:hypothetical protein